MSISNTYHSSGPFPVSIHLSQICVSPLITAIGTIIQALSADFQTIRLLANITQGFVCPLNIFYLPNIATKLSFQLNVYNY